MATAEDNVVPIDQLESLLTCSICLETLNDPRTLSCFHSFCKCCLEKFVKSQREKAMVKDIDRFNCPTCRSEFSVKPYEDVAGMPGSHFIRNMLDMMTIQRRAKTSKCSACQEASICRCITCEMFMCEKCLASHEIWPANKKHTVLSTNELTQPENRTKIKAKLYCKRHENKTLKFYCQTCKELICTHCMVLSHIKQNHSCLSIDEVADKQREALRLGCAILNEKLAVGNEALVAICNAIHLLEDNTKKMKAKIIQQKQEILRMVTQKLEEKAQLMIDEVDKMFSTKHDDLSKQLAELKAYVDKVKSSINLPKSLLEKGNNEEILSSQTMIDENIEKVKNELPRNLEPVHDGNIQYENKPINDLNVTEILDKLGEIASHPIPGDLGSTSIILKGNAQYVKQMKEWLNDECEWNLCYRASRDGWRAEDFHRHCDNKGPTVTLVRVGDYIFGGYTDQSWGGCGCKQSSSSFIFSLRNNDNLPPFKAPVYRNDEDAIHSYTYSGPTFGGGFDLYISDKPHINGHSYTNLGYTYKPPEGYSYSRQQTKTLLAGIYEFKPTEIEVFY